jgi:alkaline phosphatase
MEITMHAGGVVRRDWLKIATLGGAGCAFGSSDSRAQSAASPAKKVRGVVFMVSDGMSHGVLNLAEAWSQLTRKRGTRWWELINDRSAKCGLMDTASANSLVTDSAAASSAWGGGVRVNNGAINISPDGREIIPIAAVLKKQSKARLGLVTTATVTHATPAGFAASVPARKDESLIAPQYLERVDVILGGGSGFFDGSSRPDKRDLAADFAKAGYQIIGRRDELRAARGEKLLGTFTRGHLPFSIDRDHNEEISARVPTLTEMTTAALSRFMEGDKPFLLQVEAARVDHAAHLNDIGALLGDQLAFDDALAAVLAMTAGRDDILVIATSDHGNSNPGLCGMGNSYQESTQRFERIARFKGSHERIFSEWNRLGDRGSVQLASLIERHLQLSLKSDEIEALLSILNNQDVVEWNHQLEKPEGLLGQFTGNHTGIGWTGTTHTADYTLVSAKGPQAERFTGMVKNSDIFGHLVEMLG